ncbi:hypothetical protein ZWY2020_039811, partial [Hordeum vulgare]
EHHLPKEAKGTTSAPFNGGAFTLEVLAHAGKGDMGRGARHRLPRCEGAAGERYKGRERSRRKQGRARRRGLRPRRRRPERAAAELRSHSPRRCRIAERQSGVRGGGGGRWRKCFRVSPRAD